MKIVDIKDLKNTDRQVRCPNGGFISNRILLESDGMGYTLTKTEIPRDAGWQHWHYKNHLETCYCVSGRGLLHDRKTQLTHNIDPGVSYILDEYDDHEFIALEDTVLICVFNPPLKGQEVHQEDGSYSE
jgi:L-ectoine synthase